MARKSIQKILWKIIYLIIGALLLVPSAAFVLVIQVPIYFYRLLVTKLLAPCFRPKKGKAVSVRGQFLVTEFLKKHVTKPSKFTVLANVVQTGGLTTTELKKLISTRWLHAKNAQDDTLCYPEFQQYIEKWMGFMFWKQDDTFDLNNHIVVHEMDKQGLEQQSEDFLASLHETLLNEPFALGQSPWQVHLIQNYKTSEVKDKKLTALVFRFHHVFGDGFALARIIIEALYGCNFDSVQMQVPREKGQRTPLAVGQVLINGLTLPFQFLQDLGFILSITFSRENVWKREKVAKTDIEAGGTKGPLAKKICARTHLIPVQKLKRIKNKFGVTLSSVFLSSLSACLAKNFQAAVPVIGRSNVRISTMLPTSGHTKKLRLNVNGTIFSIDTQPEITSLERLVETEKRFKETKASFVPVVMFGMQKVLSASLAIPFASSINTNKSMPICTSNFRGPEKPFGLDSERKAVRFDVVAGSFTDVMVVMCSYNGYLRVAFTTTDKFIDKLQLQKLLKDFCDEIEILYELATKNENIEL